MATLEGDFIRWLRSPLFIRQIDVFNETVYYLGYGNNIYNFDTNSTEWKHLWKSFSTIYDMIIVEHVSKYTNIIVMTMEISLLLPKPCLKDRLLKEVKFC